MTNGFVYINKDLVTLQLQNGVMTVETMNCRRVDEDECRTIGVSVYYQKNGSPDKYELMSIEEDIDYDLNSIIGVVADTFSKNENEFLMYDSDVVLDFNVEDVKPDLKEDGVYCYKDTTNG